MKEHFQTTSCLLAYILLKWFFCLGVRKTHLKNRCNSSAHPVGWVLFFFSYPMLIETFPRFSLDCFQGPLKIWLNLPVFFHKFCISRLAMFNLSSLFQSKAKMKYLAGALGSHAPNQSLIETGMFFSSFTSFPSPR